MHLLTLIEPDTKYLSIIGGLPRKSYLIGLNSIFAQTFWNFLRLMPTSHLGETLHYLICSCIWLFQWNVSTILLCCLFLYMIIRTYHRFSDNHWAVGREETNPTCLEAASPGRRPCPPRITTRTSLRVQPADHWTTQTPTNESNINQFQVQLIRRKYQQVKKVSWEQLKMHLTYSEV